MKILPVIMCGGSGTRVWPESRESLPKQFIPLVGAESTFQLAMAILADEAFDTPVVISNHAYRFLIGEQLLKMRRLARIVLEPESRDSGPAVAVAAELAARVAPDTVVAVVADGYLWNSGNFFFRADVMQGELRAFEPEMAKAAAEAVARSRQDLDFTLLDADSFARATKKSIDYAVMERTERAAVVPADIGWSDVGNWSAVWELSERDADGNSVRGHGATLEARNVHIRSDDHLTAVVGVSDVIVVTTQDAVLVVGHEHGDKVKQLVEKLRVEGRREALEHKRAYRPWGYYQSIDNGARYQVKRIVVKPGGALSLQKHYHRAEHWIVVKGAAEVTRGNEVVLVHENESIYLPIGTIHRMVNPGKINLELIEVQTGSYLGEDDIIRIEDVYNRH